MFITPTLFLSAVGGLCLYIYLSGLSVRNYNSLVLSGGGNARHAPLSTTRALPKQIEVLLDYFDSYHLRQVIESANIAHSPKITLYLRQFPDIQKPAIPKHLLDQIDNVVFRINTTDYLSAHSKLPALPNLERFRIRFYGEATSWDASDYLIELSNCSKLNSIEISCGELSFDPIVLNRTLTDLESLDKMVLFTGNSIPLEAIEPIFGRTSWKRIIVSKIDQPIGPHHLNQLSKMRDLEYLYLNENIDLEELFENQRNP